MQNKSQLKKPLHGGFKGLLKMFNRREYNQKYYQENKGRILTKGKKWKQEHPEMNKLYCERWQERKKDPNYNIIIAKDGVEHHAINRVLMRQVKQVGCYFCGELDIDVLELAHIDEKIKKNRGFLRLPLDCLFTEIEKCEVMCPTCHRKFDLGKLRA